METIKSWISDHYVMCISAIIFIGCIIGGWLYYTASRTENDYHNANQSVDRDEAGIDRARKRLDSAQTEIKDAEKHIERADATAGKLTERTKHNTAELNECERITDRMSERSTRIQAIIRNVETANQADATQTNCNT